MLIHAFCVLIREEEKAIRRNLGEMDDSYIARIDGRYAQLKSDKWFDYW